MAIPRMGTKKKSKKQMGKAVNGSATEQPGNFKKLTNRSLAKSSVDNSSEASNGSSIRDSNAHSRTSRDSPKPSRLSWPDSLERFVIKCNLQAANDPQKKILLGQQLPRLLQLAIDSGNIHKNDWDNQKIPALHGVPNVALEGNIPEEVPLKNFSPSDDAPHIINHPWIDPSHDLTPIKKSLGLTPVTFGRKPVREEASGVINPNGSAINPNSSAPARDIEPPNTASKPPVQFSKSTPSLKKSSRSESADYVIDVSAADLKERFEAPAVKHNVDFELTERKRKRAQRFEASLASPAAPVSNIQGPLRPVEGTCQTLEKSYLRLTSEPDPSRVRPEPVLKKALAHVSRVYERDQNYRYALDQFKSMRQDLTVQNIRNSFSIIVYETNARVLLVNNDLGEFNQCQTQLQELYSAVPKPAYEAGMAQAEFFAYRIIYMILTRNDADLVKCRAQFFDDTRRKHDEDPRRPWHAFTRALFRVHVMDRLGDYSALFSLIDPFRAFPLLTLALRLLESHVVYKVRVRALLTMSRAYRKLPMSMLQNVLRLDSENAMMALFASLKIQNTINEAREWDCAAARPLLVQFTSSPEFIKVDLKGQI